MKTFVHVIRLALAGAFLLSAEIQGALATVTITGYNAGPTPFINNVRLTVNPASGLQGIRFEIAPKPGSVTRPLAATYSAAYLQERGYLNAVNGDLSLPVFGFYQNYANTVRLIYYFTDGTSQQASLQIVVPPYLDPCGHSNPIVVQARTNSTDLSYDYILVKDNCNPSPVIIDTDGEIRWVGTVGFGNFPSTFFNNGVYIANGAQLLRMELDGTFSVLADYSSIGIKDLHHCLDFGRQGLLLEADTPSQVESVVLEVDAEGNVLKRWDLADIISSAMSAGGDDPTQFVSPSPKDWFHNNATAYRKSDDSLTVSSREDFVISLDYNTGAIKWILGDPTKHWHDFASLRQFALAVGPSTLAPIGQHAVSFTHDDNLLLFDDGKSSMNQVPKGADRSYSAPRKYQIDLRNRTATEVWNYEANQTLYSAICSSVYEDDPFNYLVDYADLTTVPGGVFAELIGLDSLGEKVFDYRYPTVGCNTAFNSIPLHFEGLVFTGSAQPLTPPPIVTVSASPTTIPEGTTATFVVTASNPHPFQALTVTYSISGKGRSAENFAGSGNSGKVELPPGVSSATITLHSMPDSGVKRSQKVKLTLTSGPNYKLSRPKNATVTILKFP